jgi:tripeptidyl-peptidase-1
MPANSKSMVKASAAVPPICTKGRKCATAGTLEEPCMLHNTVYRWTTGGGFSKYIAQQPYQQAQVAAYLKSGVSFPDHHFNATNRAYPDMAAFGSRILVVSGGELGVSAGTSASTPIAAGIIALVNEKRLALKKPALGFFNPALMDMMKNCPQCFNDVTNGNNKCTNLRCCKYGYNNAKGFDAVSGVGSPNVQEWVNYLSNL